MELNTARLTLRIDPDKMAAFEWLCVRQNGTILQIVRQLMRDDLAPHDVRCVGSGASSAGSKGPFHLGMSPPRRKQA